MYARYSTSQSDGSWWEVVVSRGRSRARVIPAYAKACAVVLAAITVACVAAGVYCSANACDGAVWGDPNSRTSVNEKSLRVARCLAIDHLLKNQSEWDLHVKNGIYVIEGGAWWYTRVRIEKVLDSQGRFSHAVIHKVNGKGEDTGHATACLDYCEYLDPSSLFRTKANALSNFFYAGAAVVILAFAASDAHRIYRAQDLDGETCLSSTIDGVLIQLTLAAALVYMCVGSFLYHVTKTSGFQDLDLMSMYTIMIAFTASRVFCVACQSGMPRFASGVAAVGFFPLWVWVGSHIVRDLHKGGGPFTYTVFGLIGTHVAYLLLLGAPLLRLSSRARRRARSTAYRARASRGTWARSCYSGVRLRFGS